MQNPDEEVGGSCRVAGRPGDPQPNGVPQPRTLPRGQCPLCSSTDAWVMFAVPDRLYRTPGLFAYRRCGSCGTIFQDPMVIPEDVHLCYPTEYYTHDNPGSQSSAGVSRPHPRWLARVRDRLRLEI